MHACSDFPQKTRYWNQYKVKPSFTPSLWI